MKRLSLLFVAAVCTLPAQEKKVLPLSLAQAVELALADDGAARVRISAELVKQGEARRRQALGALIPNVDSSYTFRSFTNNMQAFGIQLPSIPGIAIPTLVGPIDTNDVRVTASQSLFDLAAIRRWQSSKAQAAAGGADFDAARNQTRGMVAKAYYAAVRADAAHETAVANVALAERILKQAQSLKLAGSGTGIEVTRAGVMLSSEKQRLIAAEEERAAARLQLLRAINAGLDVEPQLTTTLDYKPADAPDAARAIEAARALRPELKAQQGRERAARLNAEAVKWERLPSAAAFGDYGAIGKAGDSMLPTRSVGVSVKVPLWDGGRRDARRTESASQLRVEQIRTRDTSQQVELEIRLAVEALKSAEGQVRVALEAAAQSQRELEQAERRVAAGVAPGLEVTDAQARLARARETRVTALYKHKAAVVDLGVAVGNIDMVIE